MARARTPPTELARRLNSSDRPLYVVDAQYTVVFLNGAARQWLGAAADGLPGTRCTYAGAGSADGPAALAAALCPPPEAMAGATVEAAISIPAPDDRQPRLRVRFIPLGTTRDDILGVVAMAAPAAQPAAPEEASGSEPAHEPGPLGLHEVLQRFRREAAVRFGADRLVGESPAMRLARRQVELAAGCRESVLIVGPPGSGRRRTAAAIHYGAAPAPAGRLVPLACDLLSPELIYSTVQAVASGDDAPHHAQGTLLLSNADVLPLEIHGALARTLGKPSFPCRLTATAQQSPTDLARRGKYEPELAAMLSTITIELPSLAERRRDLPLLAQLFVEECNAEGERQLGGLTAEAMDLLATCRWPGNLDELAAAVREAHRHAPGPLITAKDLPRSVPLAQQAAGTPANRKEETIVLDEFLTRIERELIRRAMAQAKGNKAKAARLLGLSRSRLGRRMDHLKLE